MADVYCTIGMNLLLIAYCTLVVYGSSLSKVHKVVMHNYTERLPETKKIVGGTEVSETTFASTFPFLAQPASSATANSFCTATVIHKRFVLWAAHCVTTSTRIVRVGRSVDGEGDTYNVVNQISHPNYNEWDLSNDISVIEVLHMHEYSIYLIIFAHTHTTSFHIILLHIRWTAISTHHLQWSLDIITFTISTIRENRPLLSDGVGYLNMAPVQGFFIKCKLVLTHIVSTMETCVPQATI